MFFKNISFLSELFDFSNSCFTKGDIEIMSSVFTRRASMVMDKRRSSAEPADHILLNDLINNSVFDDMF